MNAFELTGRTNNGYRTACGHTARSNLHLDRLGAGVMGLQHMALARSAGRFVDASAGKVRRTYMAAPQPQPSRRAVALVYLGCIAVPFAVATVAYLFRAALAAAPLHPSHHNASAGSQAHQAKAPRASTMTLMPSASATEVSHSAGASSNTTTKR